jgi:hypothetical protein
VTIPLLYKKKKRKTSAAEKKSGDAFLPAVKLDREIREKHKKKYFHTSPGGVCIMDAYPQFFLPGVDIWV